MKSRTVFLLLATFVFSNIPLYANSPNKEEYVFNSIPLQEKTYFNYSIIPGYYTIFNNIDNPESSVFISKTPTPDQLSDFATNQPSYNWIITKKREAIKGIVLKQKVISRSDVQWSFSVIDLINQTHKEFPLKIENLHITEHRSLELRYGKDMVNKPLLESDKRISLAFPLFGKTKYSILPYKYIYAKLIDFIDSKELYKSTINIKDIEYKNDENERVDTKDTVCDSYLLEDKKVQVKFYDPLLNISTRFPSFKIDDETIEDKEKAKMLNDYVHNSAIYLFSVYDGNGQVFKHFCLRGNPEVTDTAFFFKIDIISNKIRTPFNPNTDSYEQYIEKTIDTLNLRGSTLFEHMAAFNKPEEKQVIGNGILFLGYYMRVLPYSEVKQQMNQIIQKETGKSQ
ncbi:MAG: hypothetical protein WC955_03085 [Elusimicrobiota bacterium]